MPTLTPARPDIPVCTPTILPTIATDEQDLDLIVAQALQRHPSFAIFTVDGRHWIDPYTGARIPMPSGNRQAARSYLMTRRPWVRCSLNPSADLDVFRWRLYLGEQLACERRLRIFAHDGRWQNPFTGALTALVAPQGITDSVLQEMAALLARCPQAQGGQLLDRLRLEAALASQHLVAHAPAQEVPTRITTRITGPRAVVGTDRTAASTGLDSEQTRLKTSLESVLSPIPTIPGYGLALHYEPMAGVGGDFYDCTRLDDHRWFIALGDVSGHGLHSARLAVSAVTALRSILRSQHDLVAIIIRLNDVLRRACPRGHFVTLYAAILDTRLHQLAQVCAGHHPALLAGRKRSCVLERVGNRGPALGLLDSAGLSTSLRPSTTTLVGGDTVFLYTDGLTEAKNGVDAEYGVHRLMGSVIAHLESPYDLLVGNVVDDTKRFTAGVIDDDLSVLALSVE
jgi:serine phosphatase RsbU (regulator of sigma subunit)